MIINNIITNGRELIDMNKYIINHIKINAIGRIYEYNIKNNRRYFESIINKEL